MFCSRLSHQLILFNHYSLYDEDLLLLPDDFRMMRDLDDASQRESVNQQTRVSVLRRAARWAIRQRQSRS